MTMTLANVKKAKLHSGGVRIQGIALLDSFMAVGASHRVS
eukprot:CAMPEP_0180418606 /NCGR_PEP_ID=MMETSP1036_2-20121128/1652_1 /TAXON_ID=632150 /ORGANISM="Azadinium spinosum, Strain 3D9" /LENGTH=39 /DNA_ID= /DNA_START= /DNA_END= /DNA_ORIENTATION=